MRGVSVPVYRLPLMPRQRIGEIRMIEDRNGKLYIDGNRVEELNLSGEFFTMVLRNGRSYYVLVSEINKLRKRHDAY